MSHSSGFGVCCTFMKSCDTDTSTKQNGTYFMRFNEDFLISLSTDIYYQPHHPALRLQHRYSPAQS